MCSSDLVPVRMGGGLLSAGEVAKLLFDNIVCLYGVPESLVHDRDPRCKACGLKGLIS